MSLSNEIRLVGHCSQAPIKVYSKSNHEIVKVAIYTNDRWCDEAGVFKEYREIHHCLFFNYQAMKAMRFLRKGTMVVLNGPMHYGTYVKRNGSKGFYANIIVEDFMLADRVLLSKEMYAELFPNKEPSRVELSRERQEFEKFEEVITQMKNDEKKFAKRQHE